MPSEAGFSLVEVLAALAIASLCLVMALQVMAQSARATARISQETAARDLAGRLLTEGATGSGRFGLVTWTVAAAPLAPHLLRREVRVDGPSAHVARIRLEPLP